MEKMKKIQINAAIFPKVMTVMLGKEKKRENETGEQINSFSDINPPELIIDLPRSVSLLYLHHISDSTERRLLEQYAYGIPFSDEDFKDLFQIIFVNVNRTWGYSKEENDVLGQFGISITKEDEKSKLVLIEDAIPQIRVETWECIIVDLLHEAAMEIINCFDFDSTYIRKIKLPDGEDKLHFSLGAWQFSPDQDEQKLSNALRTAFIFTLVSFNFGDVRNQYNNFSDFFDAEFYKRVSLIHSIWISKKEDDDIEYIPLYDSFFNLRGRQKDDLINILKDILDNDKIALDDRTILRNRLISGIEELRVNKNADSEMLETDLIKPALNFILLREKAKAAMESAKLLYDEGKYGDCADRCFYSMMFSLKALLEKKGLLADWKKDQIKEAESHRTLEVKLDDLVNQGILDESFKMDFEYVKDQRWKCDYSIYVFQEADARNCIKKVEDFYLEVELLTT